MNVKILRSSMQHRNSLQLIVKPEREQAIIVVIVWPAAMQGRVEA